MLGKLFLLLLLLLALAPFGVVAALAVLGAPFWRAGLLSTAVSLGAVRVWGTLVPPMPGWIQGAVSVTGAMILLGIGVGPVRGLLG